MELFFRMELMFTSQSSPEEKVVPSNVNCQRSLVANHWSAVGRQVTFRAGSRWSSPLFWMCSVQDCFYGTKTPNSPLIHLSSICPLIVESSANLISWTKAWWETQSLVKSEYRRGDRTHPCGAPVFRTIVDDWRLLSLIDWGRTTRKSRIQWQRDKYGYE